MHRDDFQLTVIGLLLANLAAIWLVGELVWRDMQRPPRVIRIYDGGGKAAETSDDAVA